MMETCLAKGQLASVIFGAIGGTVIICSAFAAIVWYIMYKHRKGEKILVIERRSEEGHNEFEGVKGHKIFEKRPLSDDVPLSDVSDHRSHEVQLVLQPKTDRSVGKDHQSLFDSVGLEFGSREDGIAINRVSDDLRHSNVRCGDTIRELSVSFDELTLSEAEALLTLLASYKVNLKLRRTYDEEEPKDEVDSKT
ncbi:Protein T19B10.5 [Aphelenchoides avenae]|nr:Protein T19B10.5 [Aphelenchus avenae]